MKSWAVKILLQYCFISHPFWVVFDLFGYLGIVMSFGESHHSRLPLRGKEIHRGARYIFVCTQGIRDGVVPGSRRTITERNTG